MNAPGLDVFCHFLPREYCAAANQLVVNRAFMFDRAQAIPAKVDLDSRFRVMDQFPGHKKPLAAVRRFYADTASFGSRSPIECGRSFFGSDRLLFATDRPFDPEHGPGYIRSTLQAIEGMPITDVERTAILEGNAVRVLKLDGAKESGN